MTTFSPFDGPGDPWLIGGVMGGIAQSGHHLEVLLAQCDHQVLLGPSVREAEDAACAVLPSNTSFEQRDASQAVTTIRMANEAGLAPDVLQRLLRIAGRTENGFWQMMLKVSPTAEDLNRWDADGWPDDETLALLAALRTKPAR